MKTSIASLSLVSGLALSALALSVNVQADFPRVVIDDTIVINYDKDVSVDTPDVNVGGVQVNQFNHNVDVNADTTVVGNTGLDKVTVDTTAVGNNAAVEVDDKTGLVQGNQVGSVNASTTVQNTQLNPGAMVEISTTSVGNNANLQGGGNAIQFNFDTNVSANTNYSLNAPVRPVINADPIIDTTAVGNNFSADVPSDVLQENVNGNISANTSVVGNAAVVVLDVNTTAVGNNIKIGKE